MARCDSRWEEVGGGDGGGGAVDSSMAWLHIPALPSDGLRISANSIRSAVSILSLAMVLIGSREEVRVENQGTVSVQVSVRCVM